MRDSNIRLRRSQSCRGEARIGRAEMGELAVRRLPDRTESENRVDEGPRDPGGTNSPSSLAGSERCLPDSHAWPEINIRTEGRQDSTAIMIRSSMIQLLPLTRILAALLPLTLVISGTPGAASQRAPAAQLAPPDSPDAHLGRAYDALRNDKYEMAAAEFRAALKLDPKLTLRARFPLAVSLFEMKKPEEARRGVGYVRPEAGDHPNISHYLGRLGMDVLHNESAILNFKQAIPHPPFPDTAHYLGLAYFIQGH